MPRDLASDWQVWCEFLGENVVADQLRNIESNIAVWEEQGEEALGPRAAELKAGTPSPSPSAPSPSAAARASASNRQSSRAADAQQA